MHCVDLGESFPTSIFLQKLASIQPRTSPSKFGGKFNSLFICLLGPCIRATPSCLQLAFLPTISSRWIGARPAYRSLLPRAGIRLELSDFSPKYIYLGELMSTVCSVHVGGWAGVGACSAEGGRRPGRIRRRAARGRCAEGLFATQHKPVKRQNGPFYCLTRDVAPASVAPPLRAGF